MFSDIYKQAPVSLPRRQTGRLEPARYYMKKIIVPVEVSARHIHLSEKDLEILFGKGYKLKKLRDLSQTGEFAAKEILIAFRQDHPKGCLKLRVLGPTRKESQIEISRTDAINLDVDAPLKLSGDLKKVKTFLVVKGPQGKTKVKAIVAKRHLHVSAAQAKNLKLKNGQKVNAQVVGERGLVFENVIVRVAENYNLACHIDTDEANACGLGKVCGSGYLLK